MKRYLFISVVVLIALFAACSDDDNNSDKDPKDDDNPAGNVTGGLGEDANYSLFAETLAALSLEGDAYTVFALPDSIIRIDDQTLSAAETQWHVVRGKYTADELLKAQILQTLGGQTLTVASETIEIEDEEETLVYINNVPVDCSAARQITEGIMYPVGSNIARISNAPDGDNLDAYNSWAAMAIEGTWVVERVAKRKYHVWSFSGRESIPFEDVPDPTYVGCREVFKRNPVEVNSYGCAGTYETEYRPGMSEPWAYGQFVNGPHPAEGWWAVKTERINFYKRTSSGLMWLMDWFYLDKGIGSRITYASGYGGDGYYGGSEDVIFDTYYETEWTLLKVPNRRY